MLKDVHHGQSICQPLHACYDTLLVMAIISNYLEEIAPEVTNQLNAELFTIKRTKGKFTYIWIDQGHECTQNCDAKRRPGISELKTITIKTAAQEKWFLLSLSQLQCLRL